MDTSGLLMNFVATLFLVASSIFSRARLRSPPIGAPQIFHVRLGAHQSSEGGSAMPIHIGHVLILVVFGCLSLIVALACIKFMVYSCMVSFCIGGMVGITFLLSVLLQDAVPSTRDGVFFTKLLGLVPLSEVIALVAAALLVGGWVYFRNSDKGWIFQDIIGCGFLCLVQRVFKLPSLKIAAVLLTAMFLFDIFWVLVSPHVLPPVQAWFDKEMEELTDLLSRLLPHGPSKPLHPRHSVMESVAKGGHTHEAVPAGIKIPIFGGAPGAYHLLGFGDVALPGALASFLLQYDALTGKGPCDGFFTVVVVGYFVALCACLLVVERFQTAQPALMYIVPGTLWVTVAYAWCSGDLLSMWRGLPGEQDQLFESSSSGNLMEDGLYPQGPGNMVTQQFAAHQTWAVEGMPQVQMSIPGPGVARFPATPRRY